MPAVFQKLFDCVSSVNWLRSAFLPIHWLLCEELNILSFCAVFRSVEPVLKFQASAPASKFFGSNSNIYKFLAPAPEQFGPKNKKKKLVLFV